MPFGVCAEIIDANYQFVKFLNSKLDLMKKTNFTFLSKRLGALFALTFAILTSSTNSFGQACSMACTGTVHVTLDNSNCLATVSPSMLLNGNETSCPAGSFVVEVSFLNQVIPGSPVVGKDYVGKTLKAAVIDLVSGNKCWSNIVIEDKMAPVIECPANSTVEVASIYCYEEAMFQPRAYDNCDGQVPVNVLSHSEVSNNACNQGLPTNVVRRVTRVYNAADKSGNVSARCTITYDITLMESLVQIVSPNNRLLQDGSHLQCDGNWAKLANGNPSPLAIGNLPGTGVPHVASWIPFITGQGNINATGMPNGLTLTGGTTGNGGGRVVGAEVCFVAPISAPVTFNWNASMRNNAGNTNGGSFNNDEPAYSVNGIETILANAGNSASGNVALNLLAGDRFCITVYTMNTGFFTVLNISNLVAPVSYIPIFPNDNQLCNLIVTYTDVKLPPIQCVEKIMRTWNVIEWSCLTQQRSRTFVQMIEITDSQAPEMADLQPLFRTTQGHVCGATVQLPPVSVTDNCSAPNQIRVTISGGSSFIEGNGGVTFLPVGQNLLTYTAYDACGNFSTKTLTVYVEDNTPPVAICIKNTTVAVTNDGTAWVPAQVFDSGSYDECHLAKVLVRRMNPDCTPCVTPSFPGFHYLGEFGGHHYYASKHRADKKVAYKTAKAMGGYAVSLETASEASWLYSQMSTHKPGENYLIGLPSASANRWESGNNVTYTNFSASIVGLGNYVWVNTANGLWDRIQDDGQEAFYVVEITDVCGFSEFAKFCCEDINGGSEQMVVFRAIDKAGNWNDCMVNVEVQDKLPPSITCPPHATADCREYINFENLVPRFGDAVAFDNCAVEMTRTHVANINQCNVGSITRTFVATDRGGRTASCTQHIQINNNDLFGWDDITWPLDVTMDGCDNPNDAVFHPSNLPAINGFPVLGQDKCDLVGYDWKDHVFRFNNSQGEACFKIIRKWKVIDWCQFYQGEYASWSYDQVIKVHNTTRPTITSDCGPVSTCTFDQTCSAGYIELTSTATDDCTTELKWSARIFPFNGSSFDPGLSRSGTGNTANASGVYPVGTHRVVWHFEDLCGNSRSCEQLFSIINCKAPTPYLYHGITSTLMAVDTDGDGQADNGMLEIWASDFNLNSFHPCGYDLIFSFSPDINDRVRVYDCSHVGRQFVTIYVTVLTPDGQVISSAAETYIDVQDNVGVCSGQGGGRANVAGRLATEAEEPVAQAEVLIIANEISKQVTTEDGEYAFNGIFTGVDYEVVPGKDDNHGNGVSTLDMVMVQRHILGVTSLDSPYKIIAADVTKDNRVSAADLIQMRKLVLGSIDRFENNTSWRFVDRMYDFYNPTEPLNEAFPETYNIFELNSDMDIDFVAVKVGDVNNSAKPNNFAQNIETRSAKELVVNYTDTKFQTGDLISLDLKFNSEELVNGVQFTISFDNNALEFAGLNTENAQVSEDNFGFRYLENGMISFSWNTVDAVSENFLASLNFIAKTSNSIANTINLSSSVTKAEAYTSNLEVMPVVFRQLGQTGVFALHQNTPNPFNNMTSISFELPEATQTKLTIYDVTGKVLRVINNYYEAGNHSIMINASQISASGVLYYQLEAGNYSATKKMIIIE